MRQTAEHRLQKLYEQRTALEAQIKKMEAEQAKALRKTQEQRERIVGRVIYTLVKSGQWSQAQVLELVAPHLKRASERKLFGLSLEDKTAATNKRQVSVGTAPKSKKTARKSTSSTQPKQEKTKPTPVSQSELEGEFNL